MSGRSTLWKRAAWHGLKALVCKHPGAALSGATAAVSYVFKEVVHKVNEAVSGGSSSPKPATSDFAKDHSLPDEKAEFAAFLSANDRQMLANKNRKELDG
jgi:hypothetical protein